MNSKLVLGFIGALVDNTLAVCLLYTIASTHTVSTGLELLLPPQSHYIMTLVFINIVLASETNTMYLLHCLILLWLSSQQCGAHVQ